MFGEWTNVHEIVFLVWVNGLALTNWLQNNNNTWPKSIYLVALSLNILWGIWLFKSDEHLYYTIYHILRHILENTNVYVFHFVSYIIENTQYYKEYCSPPKIIHNELTYHYVRGDFTMVAFILDHDTWLVRLFCKVNNMPTSKPFWSY